MGIVIGTTFALSLWIVLTALGVSSFDGIMLALVIVLLAAAARVAGRYIRSIAPGSRD